ncbi:MAG: Fic family protein [Nitrososphaera sp.]|uniref:Fic family protein n=1 Tax=Nitrososphaera sp. TaxID=1971748 RepID=UPI003D6F141B
MKVRGTEFDVDDYVLEPLVANLAKRAATIDEKERVLLQAAYLLFMITFRQPFLDGNKTTAFVLTKILLKKKGLDLPAATIVQKQEMFDLLNDVMYGQRGYDEVEKFVRKRVISL